MAPAHMSWVNRSMAKNDVPRGISTRLAGMLMAIKPATMSVREWCTASLVSTSFFTDLKKGVEPGIDKVERLAKTAGTTLADLVGYQAAPPPEVPSVAILEQMIREVADVEITVHTRAEDLPRIFGSALHAQLTRYRADHGVAGTLAASSARDKGARSPAPTKQAELEESHTPSGN